MIARFFITFSCYLLLACSESTGVSSSHPETIEFINGALRLHNPTYALVVKDECEITYTNHGDFNLYTEDDDRSVLRGEEKQNAYTLAALCSFDAASGTSASYSDPNLVESVEIYIDEKIKDVSEFGENILEGFRSFFGRPSSIYERHTFVMDINFKSLSPDSIDRNSRFVSLKQRIAEQPLEMRIYQTRCTDYGGTVFEETKKLEINHIDLLVSKDELGSVEQALSDLVEYCGGKKDRY